MIGEMYTPPMYRDAISSGMPMFEFDPEMMGMGSMYGCYGMSGFYNTNYLGGVRLQPNLNRDTVHILKTKEKEAENSMLTFGKLALGVIGFTTLLGLFKGKKMPWYKKMTNNFPSMPSRPVGNKTWYKPWSWFNKPATP